MWENKKAKFDKPFKFMGFGYLRYLIIKWVTAIMGK